MRIYWIAEGKQCGPVTVPDMLAKLQLGELQPDTLGWHSGCKGWAPLHQLPALAEYFEEEAAAPDIKLAYKDGKLSESDLPPVTQTVSLHLALPKPLWRFFARMVDMALYATLTLGAMYFMQVPYRSYFHPGNIFFWLPMFVIEALMMCKWGTTPGKCWLGIRLKCLRGRISFATALARCGLVFTLGLGCAFPLIAPIMLLFSYVSVQRRGVAVWDIYSAVLPIVERPLVSIQKLLVPLFLVLAFYLCSAYMLPWMPDIINEFRAQDPEQAQWLESWMSSMR